MELKVYGMTADYGNRVSFAFIKEINGKRNRAKIADNGILFWEEIPLDDGYVEMNPTISMERETAQKMMDKLYQLGFKPSDKPPLENELTATKSHLEDMRRIVSVYTKSNLTKGEL